MFAKENLISEMSKTFKTCNYHAVSVKFLNVLHRKENTNKRPFIRFFLSFEDIIRGEIKLCIKYEF